MKAARAYIAALCALAFAIVVSIAVYPAVPFSGESGASSDTETPAIVPADNQTGNLKESASASPAPSAVDDPIAYETGTMLVTLADGVSAEDALAELQNSPQLAGARFDCTVVDNLVKIALPPGLAVEEATDAALATGAVAAAQPNFRYYLQDEGATGLTAGSLLDLQAATPNDPYYRRQWYLDSINAPEAWDIAAAAASQSKPVTIAVMDAAFNATHDDLKGNVASTYSPLSWWEIIGDSPSQENIRHGTHTAGTIAAIANNGIGIAGVADNLCKVSLMRVSNSRGEMTTASIVSAYNNVMINASALNIRVVSMSLGSGSEKEMSHPTDAALYNAIEKARDAGIVTVAAACNSDDDYDAPYYAYPADFDNVVAVINVGEANNADGLKRDSWSNYNKGAQKAKNISAPGENIYSLYANGYGSLSGTSMSTPQVAAIFGLMFTAYPSLSADEAVSLLYSSAHDLSASHGTSVGWDAQTGFGEADAAAALDASRPYLSGDPLIDKTGKLSVKINGETQSASDWKWTTSDPSIARVTATGKVIGYKKGQAIITATKGSKKAVQVVDVVKTSSSTVDVKSLNIKVADKTYKGSKRKPVPKVYDGATLLERNKHYTVKYANNLNAGKAKVKITGIGPYEGTVAKTFTIRKADIAKAKINLKTKPSGKLAVTVSDIGKNAGNVLVRGVDYSASKFSATSVKITATDICTNFTGSTIVELRQ